MARQIAVTFRAPEGEELQLNCFAHTADPVKIMFVGKARYGVPLCERCFFEADH